MQICVPIRAKTQAEVIKKMKQIARHADFAELWLDEINDLNLEKLLAHKPLPVICTSQQAERILEAINNGVEYVNFHSDMPKNLSTKVIQYARKNKVKTILSYHDFSGTPEFSELLKLALSMKKRGANLIKIACMAKSFEDTIRMIALANELKGKVSGIFIAMGPKGTLSRILTPTLDSEMMFASLTKKDSMHGQLTVKQLRKAWELLT